MEKNIAVIGCGYWGKNLVRNFAELGALHTICESNPEALERLQALYPNINQEKSLESVLANSEIKGVVISTPAAAHYSMAQQALTAGKDVLVEKPLSLTVKEGEELVKLAKEKDRILMVGHLLEYHPAIVKLKELVESGELGRLKYIYSSRLNLGKFRTEENILWSFAPHDISMILLLVNDMPQEISAHGGNYLHQDIADVTVTTMSFGGGVRAHIFVSWLHPYKEQKLVVIGDRKMAVFDDVSSKNKLMLYDYQIDWSHGIPIPRKQEAIPIQFAMVEPLRLECQAFIDCLKSRCRPKADGASGLRVLQVLDASQRSLQEQGHSIFMASKSSVFIHSTSLVEEPSSIGSDTKIWRFSHIMPHAIIGKKCTIGQNVFIGSNVNIGNNVKIENDVSIFDGVTLEDDVFCGPSCVFTNIKNPRSHISRKDKFISTIVKKGATIGANATIVCGNTIGEYALIGAGAVVTKNVPDHALVYGNPARNHGWVCKCGIKLDFRGTRNARCPECNEEYTMKKPRGSIRVERINL